MESKYEEAAYHTPNDADLTTKLQEEFKDMTYKDIISLMICYLYCLQNTDEKNKIYENVLEYLLNTSVEKSTFSKKINVNHISELSKTIIKLLIKDKEIGKELSSNYPNNEKLLYNMLTLQLYYILPRTTSSISKYSLLSNMGDLKGMFTDVKQPSKFSLDDLSTDDEDLYGGNIYAKEGSDSVKIKSLNKIIKQIQEKINTLYINRYIGGGDNDNKESFKLLHTCMKQIIKNINAPDIKESIKKYFDILIRGSPIYNLIL